jgi:hypothetical protein
VPRRFVAWVGFAVVLAFLGCLAALHAARRDDPVVAAPAWAARCFTRPVTVSSADQAYLGLTRVAAERLAAQRGQSLQIFGAEHHCLMLAGVALARPVAVSFDIGSNGGIPAGARIDFASSDAGAAMQGE